MHLTIAVAPLVTSVLQLRHYSSCATTAVAPLVAPLLQLCHYGSCATIAVVPLWQLRHYSSCTTTAVAPLQQLRQEYISTARLYHQLQLQKYISSYATTAVTTLVL